MHAKQSVCQILSVEMQSTVTAFFFWGLSDRFDCVAASISGSQPRQSYALNDLRAYKLLLARLANYTDGNCSAIQGRPGVLT